MENFNQYQYNDLLNREADIYANTKYRVILQYLADQSNLRILNAGCGAGELSFLLAQAGHRVTGIDPAGEYIALAEKRLAASLRTRCSFLVSSIEEFVSNEKFDCVIATDVLEHIADDYGAAQKLAALAAAAGDIIVTVPALPILFGYHDELLGHYRRYTKSSLRRLFNAAAGVNIKRLRYFGFTLIPISFIYSKWLRKSYPAAPSGKAIDGRLRELVLNPILAFGLRVVFPLGTSLIMMAKRD